MQQQTARSNAGMNQRGEQAQDQRGAQDDARVCGIVEAGNELGVQDAENQRGDGHDEADQWAGSANVK